MKRRNENSFVWHVLLTLMMVILAAELIGIYELFGKGLSFNFIYAGLFWNSLNLLFIGSLVIYLSRYNRRSAVWFNGKKNFANEYEFFIKRLTVSPSYMFTPKNRDNTIEFLSIDNLSSAKSEPKPTKFSFFLKKGFAIILSVM